MNDGTFDSGLFGEQQFGGGETIVKTVSVSSTSTATLTHRKIFFGILHVTRNSLLTIQKNLSVNKLIARASLPKLKKFISVYKNITRATTIRLTKALKHSLSVASTQAYSIVHKLINIFMLKGGFNTFLFNSMEFNQTVFRASLHVSMVTLISKSTLISIIKKIARPTVAVFKKLLYGTLLISRASSSVLAPAKRWAQALAITASSSYSLTKKAIIAFVVRSSSTFNSGMFNSILFNGNPYSISVKIYSNSIASVKKFVSVSKHVSGNTSISFRKLLEIIKQITRASVSSLTKIIYSIKSTTENTAVSLRRLLSLIKTVSSASVVSLSKLISIIKNITESSVSTATKLLNMLLNVVRGSHVFVGRGETHKKSMSVLSPSSVFLFGVNNAIKIVLKIRQHSAVKLILTTPRKVVISVARATSVFLHKQMYMSLLDSVSMNISIQKTFKRILTVTQGAVLKLSKIIYVIKNVLRPTRVIALKSLAHKLLITRSSIVTLLALNTRAYVAYITRATVVTLGAVKNAITHSFTITRSSSATLTTSKVAYVDGTFAGINV